MATVILDQHLADCLIAERKRLRHDRRDEVWEGIYMMAPAPRDLHAQIVSDLIGILKPVIEWRGLGSVRHEANISNRIIGWEKNYRIPDACVMLKGGKAKNYDTFWLGGPDFVVEVRSPDEDPYKKIAFYGSIGVRELLVVDTDPWKLELFRLTNNELKLAAEVTLGSTEFDSEVIPFRFGLAAGPERPVLVVTNTETAESRRF